MTEIKSFTVKNDDVSFWREFAKMKWKDRVSQSELIVLACKEYYNHHKDGNPNFSLDQFSEKDFKACPALFIHCHPVCLTYTLSTSGEMSGWMSYKLESR